MWYHSLNKRRTFKNFGKLGGNAGNVWAICQSEKMGIMMNVADHLVAGRYLLTDQGFTNINNFSMQGFSPFATSQESNFSDSFQASPAQTESKTKKKKRRSEPAGVKMLPQKQVRTCSVQASTLMACLH